MSALSPLCRDDELRDYAAIIASPDAYAAAPMPFEPPCRHYCFSLFISDAFLRHFHAFDYIFAAAFTDYFSFHVFSLIRFSPPSHFRHDAWPHAIDPMICHCHC